MRELAEVTEFYVDENNKPKYNVIYHKNVDGTETTNDPSKYLIEYLANQGVDLNDDSLVEEIDYDALDDLAKADKQLEIEKQETKKEQAYYENFGEEPVEEEKEAPKAEPQIDLTLLNKPKEEVKPATQVAPKPPVAPKPIPTAAPVATPVAPAPVENKVAATPAPQETADNMYNYDYSQTSGENTQVTSNPLDIEKTQYLDPVNLNAESNGTV